MSKGALNRKMSNSSFLELYSRRSPRSQDMNEGEDNESEPIFEARKYLRRVIVTFKGIKSEPMWR